MDSLCAVTDLATFSAISCRLLLLPAEHSCGGSSGVLKAIAENLCKLDGSEAQLTLAFVWSPLTSLQVRCREGNHR